MRFSFREWILILAVFILLAGWGVDRRMMAARFSSQEKQISRLQEDFAEYERLSKLQRDDSSFKSLKEYLELRDPNAIIIDLKKHYAP
jgi:hypothetical protein